LPDLSPFATTDTAVGFGHQIEKAPDATPAIHIES
jgi:hypothetical protein